MNDLFNGILNSIYQVVHSYGWTVVLFTLLFKLVLTPLDFKSRKSMRRMEKINPQLEALKKKYGNDKEKLAKKQQELYSKEGVSALGGCLPMLLTLPIFFIMFAAMRNMANRELVQSMLAIQNAVQGLTDSEAIRAALPPLHTLTEPFLWIKNLWVADSPFTSILPNASSTLAALGTQIEGVITKEGMDALKVFVDSDVYQSIILPHYGATKLAGGDVNLLLFTLSLFKTPNGYFVLPVVSYAFSYLSTLLTNPQAAQTASAGQAQATPGGGFMKWGMPLFMAYICATSTAAFAIYYTISNVFTVAQQFIFRKYFEAQDAMALAQSKEVNKL